MIFRARNKDRLLRVRARGVLAGPPGRDTLVSVAMGATGPAAIWASKEGAQQTGTRFETAGGPSFPRTQHSVSLVSYSDPSTFSNVVVCPDLSMARPLVNQFEDGSFLIADARCVWSESGPEENALIVSPDGGIVRRGCLGDGLEHVQVAHDDTIWTGYFDEGVFGNLGWGRPGPTPLGAAGIASWSRSFEKIWELDPSEDLVADCYALNVSRDAVLACPYTDFPVVRIVDNQPTVYLTEGISGPRGIIAANDQVGIVGTYHDTSLLVVGELTDGRFVEQRRTNLWLPDGDALPLSRMHSRGSEVHFFVDARWFSFALEDLDQ